METVEAGGKGGFFFVYSLLACDLSRSWRGYVQSVGGKEGGARAGEVLALRHWILTRQMGNSSGSGHPDEGEQEKCSRHSQADQKCAPQGAVYASGLRCCIGTRADTGDSGA